MILFLAVVSMLMQQAVAFMSTLVLPIAATEIHKSLGFELSWIGAYSAILYAMGMVSAMSSGLFIMRFGALRMSQIALVLMGCGLLIGTSGLLMMFALAALLIGCGSSLSTPASSEILARYSPPKMAPLIFSIKQTGVPVGGLMAGLLVPAFVAWGGWQGGFIGAAIICFFLAVLLQPLRREFDRHRDPARRMRLIEVFSTMKLVLDTPPLRRMAFSSITFVGLQAVFGAFMVAYMTTVLNYDLTKAGILFAVAQATAIGARILWGWIASRFVRPSTLLALLALAMSAAAVAVGLYSVNWPEMAVLAAATAYACTALSWHGVLLAEVARLAPPGRVGAVTGGVLTFTSIGMMIYPGIFGFVLEITADYGTGYILAGLPALIAGIWLLIPKQKRAP